MIPELRKEFNAAFTERKYRHFCERLNHRCRTDIRFRVAEMPCFVPRDIQRQCEEAAVELTLQAHRPEYLALSDATLQPEYTVANQPDRALFLTVDFAMTQGPDGTIVPKLIELQGFPSLMGFQLNYAELSQEHYALPPELGYVNGGHTRRQFLDIFRRAVVADEDPENVVLMEIDPWNQKTNPDFHCTRELLGISVVDIRDITKVGSVLHYSRDGRLIPIRRIYNRAIVDELQRRGVELPFNWSDDLDVAWAGHPNWYFRISKFTLPYLDHPLVPKATFLHELEEIPDNLENYVLKPLYSFAGAGVVVGPSRAEIDAIPVDRRPGYLLQERITYAGAIDTPEGPTKAEIRFMLIWLPEEERPCPVMGLVRMGRGKLMGVDFNSATRWIGAGCNFFEP
ncbi:MAG TPA: hypothetical protein VHI13_15875 [Candidatus Kapabacteria bacterium]|nr:hypothetical protein [Candidatus Kapabacteria bacterium]